MENFVAVLEAFAAGAVSTELLHVASARIRKALHRRRPMECRPNPRVHPDPRNEAAAILEISSWNFPEAHAWISDMIHAEPQHIAFWERVRACVEIYQAGRQPAKTMPVRTVIR